MTKSVDYIRYDPTIPFITWERFAAIRKELPNDVKVRISKCEGYRTDDDICANIDDSELVATLDRLLEIGRNHNFVKGRRTEITKRELNRFPFYEIDPRSYEVDRDVFFELTRPTCPRNTRDAAPCPWGSEITSPIRLHRKIVQKLGIGRIGRIWEIGIELLISAEVKRLFDELQVTGLSYEECEVGTARERDSIAEPVAYVARIEPTNYYTADDVLPRNSSCPEHGFISKGTYIFNQRIPYSRLGNEDFQLIDRLRVGENEYRYVQPPWIVSRRLVKLLLDQKVKGLRVMTWSVNEKFRPLVNLTD